MAFIGDSNLPRSTKEQQEKELAEKEKRDQEQWKNYLTRMPQPAPVNKLGPPVAGGNIPGNITLPPYIISESSPGGSEPNFFEYWRIQRRLSELVGRPVGIGKDLARNRIIIQVAGVKQNFSVSENQWLRWNAEAKSGATDPFERLANKIKNFLINGVPSKSKKTQTPFP